MPFYENAKILIQMVNGDELEAWITANSITDIVYLSRKALSPNQIQHFILKLLETIGVIGVDKRDILAAFDLGFSDFEDALQSACSHKDGLDCIVTRNSKDFALSKVPAVDISDFLARHYAEDNN